MPFETCATDAKEAVMEQTPKEHSYLSLVGHRYSCRKFADTQVDDEQLRTVLEAARKSPSARNNQPVASASCKATRGLRR